MMTKTLIVFVYPLPQPLPPSLTLLAEFAMMWEIVAVSINYFKVLHPYHTFIS